MPESAVWGAGHWGQSYWGVMYIGGVGSYKPRVRRPLKSKPFPQQFFTEHMSEWPVLLQYLWLKHRRKENEQLQNLGIV